MKSLILAALLAAGAKLAADVPKGVVDPLAKDIAALDTAKDAGLVGQTTVYSKQRPDGGEVFVSITPNKDGGADIQTFVDKSPCAWKLLKADVCTRLDGGDPGLKTTMLDGQWTGAGCVRKSCVIMQGEKE